MHLKKQYVIQALGLCIDLTLSACGGGSSSATNNNTTNSGGTDTTSADGTPSSGGSSSGGTTSSGTPASGGTTTSGTTPSGGGSPSPTPTATAAECPFGDYKSAVVAEVNAMRASARYCDAYTNLRTGAFVPAGTYPAAGSLNWQSQLAFAAEVHSNDMAINNYFGHYDANGVSVIERAGAAGYAFDGSIGENIAGGYSSASQVVAGWMISGSHCANIMKSSYVDIGVSCKYNPNSTSWYYWTLTLGNH